jgi:putative FmdB family regulatory protein
MPIYEYRCDTCGQTEELLQGLSADPRHDCACGAPMGMLRQPSVPALASPEPGYAGQPDAPPCASGGGCGGGCPFAG